MHHACTHLDTRAAVSFDDARVPGMPTRAAVWRKWTGRAGVLTEENGTAPRQEHAGNTGLGHIPLRSRRWLMPVAPEDAACQCVGAAVISKMFFMFGILLMTVSWELAGCEGVNPVREQF